MKEGAPVLIKAEWLSTEGDKTKVRVWSPWGAHVLVIVKSSEVVLDEPSP